MSKIIGIIILTTVVSLILLSLFLTLTNSSPQTQKGSPENIVQTYITSIVEEKFNNSYSLLSKDPFKVSISVASRGVFINFLL